MKYKVFKFMLSMFNMLLFQFLFIRIVAEVRYNKPMRFVMLYWVIPLTGFFGTKYIQNTINVQPINE